MVFQAITGFVELMELFRHLWKCRIYAHINNIRHARNTILNLIMSDTFFVFVGIMAINVGVGILTSIHNIMSGKYTIQVKVLY
jgi:hypothetical protein